MSTALLHYFKTGEETNLHNEIPSISGTDFKKIGPSTHDRESVVGSIIGKYSMTQRVRDLR